ncbi:MAG: PDZ domain-containing protein, partial [Planctomycetia bacterium]|nr:PDZ domain-containing protein [Planctomycetia bacterium]
MRGSLVLVVLFVGTASLTAAPLDLGENKAAGPLAAADAERFAVQLFSVVDQVARNYVRPVPRSKLLTAALSGLYEEVPTAVPADWPARFEKALKDSGYEDETEIKQVAGFERPALPPATSENLSPILKLIAEQRRHLGDREALRNAAGLRIAVQAMARALDPYSKLVEGGELRKSNGEDAGNGLGLEFAADAVDGPWPIKHVVLGSPAQRAGIKPGDRVSHIDGKPASATVRGTLAVMERLVENGPAAAARKLELTVQP